jgi:hypothetical protein
VLLLDEGVLWQMAISPKYAELRKLSDDELVTRFDAAATNTVVGTSFFLEELARRSQRRQSDEMLAFTKQVRNMTVIITILTAVNVLLVLATFLQ